MKRFTKAPWRRIRNLLLTVILVSIVVIAGACQAPPISEDALATEVAATIYAEQVAGTSAGASPAYTTSTPHTSALEPLATSTPQPTPTSSLPQVGTPLPASLNPIMPDNVGEMEPLALWGRGIINSLAYSPDGSVLAIASSLGVYLYDAETLADLGKVAASPGASKVAFSPNGEFMAILHGGEYFGYQTELVRTHNLTSLGISEESWTEIQHVAFADDSESYFEIGNEITQREWDEYGLWSNHLYQLSDDGREITLSPSGSLLAIGPDWMTGSDSGCIEIVEIASGETIVCIEARPWVTAFSHDDQILAVASYEGIQLWELGSGTLQETLESSRLVTSDMDEGEDFLNVHHLAFAPGHNMLGFTSGEGSLWTWDWSKDEISLVAESLGSYPRFVFTQEGNGVAVITDQRMVQRIELPGGNLQAGLKGFAQPARQLGFSAEGELLALESYNERIVARDFSNGSPQWEFDRELGSFLAISPQGDRYVDTYRDTSSRTSIMQIWGLPNGDLQHAFTLPALESEALFFSSNPEPISATFSLDGNILAIRPSDDIVHLLNAYDQTTLSTIEISSYDAEGVALSQNNNVIAFGGEDAIIRIYEIASGIQLHKLARQAGGIVALKFSPDGRSLASVTHDGITVWSWEDGEVRYMLEPSLPGAQDRYISLINAVYSQDGQILAAGCRTHDVIWLWDAHEGTHLTTLMGSERTCGTTSLAFSPDGSTLAQGLEDGTVRIWGIP